MNERETALLFFVVNQALSSNPKWRSRSLASRCTMRKLGMWQCGKGKTKPGKRDSCYRGARVSRITADRAAKSKPAYRNLSV